MGLEDIARFLADHPDWAPALMMGDDDVPTVYGFHGPQGGFFDLEDIRRLLARPRSSFGGWKKRRSK